MKDNILNGTKGLYSQVIRAVVVAEAAAPGCVAFSHFSKAVGGMPNGVQARLSPLKLTVQVALRIVPTFPEDVLKVFVVHV